MNDLQGFAYRLLERHGAIVEAESELLHVLAPDSLRAQMQWPEMISLAFGSEAPSGSIPVGFEGDWLRRFGDLLGEAGRWRRVCFPAAVPSPPSAERLLDKGLVLPNAVARVEHQQEVWTRCLILVFRYSAVADEKREGLVSTAINLASGASLDGCQAPLRAAAANAEPAAASPQAAETLGRVENFVPRLRALVGHRVQGELDPFLRGVRRRMERDRQRIHAYHSGLQAEASRRLAAMAGSGENGKAEREGRREQWRLDTIEREYRSKIEDLRRNYAVRVRVEWVQGLEILAPVHRIEVMIHRRKGQRRIAMDWFPQVRALEPPPCDWGLGLGRERWVCDERLHLTDAGGQEPCPECDKSWCRACSPVQCPRCQRMKIKI